MPGPASTEAPSQGVILTLRPHRTTHIPGLEKDKCLHGPLTRTDRGELFQGLEIGSVRGLGEGLKPPGSKRDSYRSYVLNPRGTVTGSTHQVLEELSESLYSEF